jgi:hypothetical protein
MRELYFFSRVFGFELAEEVEPVEIEKFVSQAWELNRWGCLQLLRWLRHDQRRAGWLNGRMK